MADNGVSVEHKNAPNVEEPRPSKPQWEQLDKDELTKQMKKQLMLLQKLKLKCDDVGKKNASLEAELNEKNSECTDLKAKLDLAESEKIDGSSKIASLELDNLNMNRNIKALEEQVECMALKQETANTTFQCLQQEIKKFQTENKELTEEVYILTAARDKALQSLKSIKDTLSLELALVKQELVKAQAGQVEANQENKNLLNEIEKSHRDLRAVESKHFDLEANYNELQSQFKALNDEHEDKIQKLEASFAECKQDLEDVTSEKQNLMSKLYNYQELEAEVEEIHCREKSHKEVVNCEVKAELDEIKLQLEQTLNDKFALDEKVECFQRDFDILQLKLDEVELKNTNLEEKYCEVQSEKQTLNEALFNSEARVKVLEDSLAKSNKAVKELSNEMLVWTLDKKNYEELQLQLNELVANKSSLQQQIDAQHALLTEIYWFAGSLCNPNEVFEDVNLHFNSSIDLVQLIKDGINSVAFTRNGSDSLNEDEDRIIQSLKSKVTSFEDDNRHHLESMANLKSLVEILDSKVTTLETRPKIEMRAVECETEQVTSESVCIGTRIEMADAFTEMNEEFASEVSVLQDPFQKLNVSTEMESCDGCDPNVEKIDAFTEMTTEWFTNTCIIAPNENVIKVDKYTDVDEMFMQNEDGKSDECASNSSSVLGVELNQELKMSSGETNIHEAALLGYSNKVWQLRQVGQAIECSLRNIFHEVEASEETEKRSDTVNSELQKLKLHLDTLPKSSEESPELAFSEEIRRLDNFDKMLFVLDNIFVEHMQQWKAKVQSLTEEISEKETLTSSKTEQLLNNAKRLESELKSAGDLVNKYKNVAIKVKKETVELKKQVSDINSEFERAVEERDLLKNQVEHMSSQMAVVNKEKSIIDDKEKAFELQLTREKEKHRITLNKLDHALKEANKNNLISLEIADYERLMKDLNKQMENKTTEINKLQTEISFHKEKIDGFVVQIEQLEEQKLQSEARGDQLKALSVKLKAEIADLRKTEGEWKTTESALLAQVEATSREVENYKLQIANTMADNQRLQELNRAMQDAHNRAVCLLENRNSSLIEELYKVRVHSVLKHKKSKLGSSDSVPVGSGPYNTDMNVEEKEHLEKTVEALQTRVQELVTQLTTAQSELETLSEEHDNLLQRHNKLVLNINEQESSWKQRVERLQKDLLIEQKEHTDVLRQVQQQHQLTLNLSLKQQMETLQKEHSQQLEEMQLKLDLSHDELLRLQKEVADAKVANATLAKDEDVIVDILNTERQEGESTPPASSFVPFDQLLNQDRLSVSSISASETEKLDHQLAVATKRIEHMTEILHESEATNARMTEQTRVLKEEIRRLERNQEREQHFANMEYVKNVIVKFLSLPSGDERERLVPVLTMLLRLSREEEHEMHSIAKGEVESQTVAGWGSYLPRWPGS